MESSTLDYAHPEALVSPEWLLARLDDPKVRVVDGRFDLRVGTDGSIEPHAEVEAYTAGHVPGAVFLDLMGDLSDPDDPTSVPTIDRFEVLMARLGIDNDTSVVIYDGAGGTWGARLWWALRYHGHDDVALLNGGFVRWENEGHPVEPGVVTPPDAKFTARIRPEMRVTADDVEAAIDDPATCIVDALPEAIYRGEMSLYPNHRPGHVPGARNVPAPSNLDPTTSRLLAPADLARLWESLEIDPDQRVITYCGGGVYASFALFALHLLGHENAALYDASWSEWGADPRRPVEIEVQQT